MHDLRLATCMGHMLRVFAVIGKCLANENIGQDRDREQEGDTGFPWELANDSMPSER